MDDLFGFRAQKSSGKRIWIPIAELRLIVREAPADPGLLADLAEVRGTELETM
jgi:hypothetical protein